MLGGGWDNVSEEKGTTIVLTNSRRQVHKSLGLLKG